MVAVEAAVLECALAWRRGGGRGGGGARGGRGRVVSLGNSKQGSATSSLSFAESKTLET